MQVSQEPKITLTPFKFPGLTIPNGFLSRDMRAQACWYFYTLAQQMKERLDESSDGTNIKTLEGELWMAPAYVQLAKSVATLYGLESPSEFAKAWDQVREQAAALMLPEPAPEYTRLAPGIITRLH